MHCMLCMSTLSTQRIKAHKALNAIYIDTVETGVCGFYTTLYTVYSTLYTRPLTPPKRKACTAFHLMGLAVHQSEKAALLTFWDLLTTRVNAGKIHSQSQILKN